jgi:hypothetical protein
MISKDFLLAGNATFTVSNPQGEHYTFKVNRPKHELDRSQMGIQRPAPYFIRVLTGPDNENSYTYLGMVKEDGVHLTKASKYTKDSKPYRVADWAVRGILAGGDLPDGYNIDHAGTCGRCGRKLTTPESIATGLGPVCREMK